MNCKQTLKSFAHFTQIDGGYLNCGQIFHSPLKRYIRISITKRNSNRKILLSLVKGMLCLEKYWKILLKYEFENEIFSIEK